MKYFVLVMISLNLLSGCDWRSKATQPENQEPPSLPISSLEQWSGRSDYVGTRWQIKSRP
ncbi:hypothetical protein [Oligoflexus tunisiensis]|uniref:hypothetical protein n=1 Tax=Oligoflexus tunisiensis TaxID=708132 RepID=UPI00114CECF4|nr:hypothetical protein [Oligoflexus tunisiensis]